MSESQLSAAISAGWTPTVRAQASQKRRALYADPVRGAKTRNALQIGRSDPAIRARATATMRAKVAADPVGYSELMGAISRKAKRTPRWRKNMSRAMTPERRGQKSKEMKGRWAERNAILKAAREQHDVQTRVTGRPRNEVLRNRVQSLRKLRTSWARIKLILDKETGQKRALTTYRGYAE